MALSATVLAGSPGAAGALQPAPPAPAGIRFEPVADGPDGLTVAGTGTFRGALHVRRHGPALAVVNDVGFEDYVRGIDEVPFAWPAAALQAQAIAARTYAAHKAASSEATPWRAVGADICATPRCQVYRGLDAERRAAGHGWLPAVKATEGKVLLEGGRPIMASYSSTANGPRAMSQNGALEMANAGRSASEILAAYYGIGPTSARGKLPARIKVALDTGTKGVRVTANRPFRVLDEAGRELAVAAGGDWNVVTAGAGVQLVPPEGHDPSAVPGGDASAGAPELVAAVRRPGRAVSAALPGPGRGPWAAPALVLLAATGLATITLGRRRRA